MIPIYFPFTYLSASTATALQACLGSFAVYQPSGLGIPESLRRQEKDGWVDIRVPEQPGAEKLDRILKAYTQWAALHQGNQLDYLKARGTAVPFFEEVSTAQIKADIKGTGVPRPTDPLFNARLFLQAAQEFDAQNDELAQRLLATIQAARDLYRRLTGADEPNSREHFMSKTAAGPAREEYMTFERLIAWGTLFLHDRRLHESKKQIFMVTSSRTVLELLQAHLAGIRMVRCVKNIPLEGRPGRPACEWREKLEEILAAPTEEAESRGEPLTYPGGAASGPRATLSVYVSAETPFQFFLRLSKRAGPPPDREDSDDSPDRRLWGLIDIE